MVSIVTSENKNMKTNSEIPAPKEQPLVLDENLIGEYGEYDRAPKRQREDDFEEKIYEGFKPFLTSTPLKRRRLEVEITSSSFGMEDINDRPPTKTEPLEIIKRKGVRIKYTPLRLDTDRPIKAVEEMPMPYGGKTNKPRGVRIKYTPRRIVTGGPAQTVEELPSSYPTSDIFTQTNSHPPEIAAGAVEMVPEPMYASQILPYIFSPDQLPVVATAEYYSHMRYFWVQMNALPENRPYLVNMQNFFAPFIPAYGYLFNAPIYLNTFYLTTL